MERRSIRAISVLVVLLGSVWLAHGQTLGRFAYRPYPKTAGLLVDGKSIRSIHPQAEPIVYSSGEGTKWKPLSLNSYEARYYLSAVAGGPEKARVNLYSQGVEFYFPTGMSLRSTALASPLLTWKDASVGPGIPTAASKWVVISFQTPQPPLLIAFLDSPQSLIVRGAPSDWRIEATAGFRGWARILTPTGVQSAGGSEPAALGRLAARVSAESAVWSAPAANLISRKARQTKGAVIVEWKFDRLGAVIPRAAMLAGRGGYAVKMSSAARFIDCPTDEGPTYLATGDTISVRFPIRDLQLGRSAVLGAPIEPPIGTVSPFDIPSVVDQALSLLVSSSDPQSRQAAEDAALRFLKEAVSQPEPNSGQRFLFQESGAGADLVAAHALLSQALQSSAALRDQQNALLTSLGWLQDAGTWMPAFGDPVVARRCAAISALAGALSVDPEQRAAAAMYQAGLAAERGLAVWRREKGLSKELPQFVEPLQKIRISLFVEDAPLDPFMASLGSPLRVLDPIAIRFEPDPSGILVKWNAAEWSSRTIGFSAAFPIEWSPVSNLASGRVVMDEGRQTVRYAPKTAGECVARIILPPGIVLPKAAAVPRYMETKR